MSRPFLHNDKFAMQDLSRPFLHNNNFAMQDLGHASGQPAVLTNSFDRRSKNTLHYIVTPHVYLAQAYLVPIRSGELHSRSCQPERQE